MRTLKFFQAVCALTSLALAEYAIVFLLVVAQDGYTSGRLGILDAAVISFSLIVLVIQTPEVIASVLYSKSPRAAAREVIGAIGDGLHGAASAILRFRRSS